MKIFKKYHGSVIGKGGSTLKKIREETNTKIEMPKEDMESDVIVITGRKEDAELAKRKLLEIEKQMVWFFMHCITYPVFVVKLADASNVDSRHS